MTVYSVREADPLKSGETDGMRDPAGGAQPKPIRKRGFHRALRRGEHWAQSIQLSNDMMETLDSIHATFAQQMLQPTAFDRFIIHDPRREA